MDVTAGLNSVVRPRISFDVAADLTPVVQSTEYSLYGPSYAGYLAPKTVIYKTSSYGLERKAAGYKNCRLQCKIRPAKANAVFWMLRRVALVRTDVLRRLLVTAIVIPSSPTVTLIEAIPSSETSVYPAATRLKIPEDGILHRHRRENLKSYKH
jgi:hypothetical protein